MVEHSFIDFNVLTKHFHYQFFMVFIIKVKGTDRDDPNYHYEIIVWILLVMI